MSSLQEDSTSAYVHHWNLKVFIDSHDSKTKPRTTGESFNIIDSKIYAEYSEYTCFFIAQLCLIFVEFTVCNCMISVCNYCEFLKPGAEISGENCSLPLDTINFIFIIPE